MTTHERQAERLLALAESSKAFAEASTDPTRLLNLVARRFAELVGDRTNSTGVGGLGMEVRLGSGWYVATGTSCCPSMFAPRRPQPDRRATFGFRLPERGPTTALR